MGPLRLYPYILRIRFALPSVHLSVCARVVRVCGMCVSE